MERSLADTLSAKQTNQPLIIQGLFCFWRHNPRFCPRPRWPVTIGHVLLAPPEPRSKTMHAGAQYSGGALFFISTVLVSVPLIRYGLASNFELRPLSVAQLLLRAPKDPKRIDICVA